MIIYKIQKAQVKKTGKRGVTIFKVFKNLVPLKNQGGN